MPAHKCDGEGFDPTCFVCRWEKEHDDEDRRNGEGIREGAFSETPNLDASSTD